MSDDYDYDAADRVEREEMALDELRDKLAAVTAERDRLREACEAFICSLGLDGDWKGPRYQAALTSIHEALQPLTPEAR